MTLVKQKKYIKKSMSYQRVIPIFKIVKNTTKMTPMKFQRDR